MRRTGRVVLVLCFAAAAAPSLAEDGVVLAGERSSVVSEKRRPVYKDAAEALRAGIQTYRAGDARNSVDAFNYAAQGGQTLAQWKLGKMYAAGDGVAADDYKAYQYFLKIVDGYDEDATPRRELSIISSAFVAVGAYNLTGIGSSLPADPRRAMSMFQFAATNFGDPNAQYNLARMYIDGAGVEKDNRQAARWLRLAAEKGHAPSQAMLGHLLFTGQEGVPRQRALGLMYLTMARESIGEKPAPADKWIADLYAKAIGEAADNDRQAALAFLESYLKKR
ncbi:MAG: sel1 repeat family protein [Hyphomicrobiales bacterium]|nr:sel1 repeat family protein [Hyphomicrobiales bacterium]